MHLPDINVWLALTFDSHVHHASAKAWFDGLGIESTCYFCRLTQQGFLRLSTNPKVFGTAAVTLPEAWKNYDLFQSDPRVEFADEPLGLVLGWRSLTHQNTFSPNVWNDAYLAAFAIAANWEIVTFDKGFARFANLKYRLLT